MKNNKTYFCLIAILIYALCHIDTLAQTNEKSIEIGKSIDFNSKVLNEKRAIQIYLPQSYSNNLYSYPVFYVTDGEDNFLNAVSVVKGQSDNLQHMPEMIIVAIGSGSNRNKNFTIIDKSADKTLDFIKSELIPYIDSTYRTEKYRILLGHSLAGPFVFYTLSKYPDLFNAYVILSPSMHHKLSQPATQIFEKYLAAPDKMHKSFYIGVSEGDKEGTQNSYKMLDSLFKLKAPKTFDFRFEKLEGEDHWSEPLIGIYKGLNYIYKTWRIPTEVVDKADISLLKSHINSLSELYGYKVKYPEDLLTFIGMEFVEPEGQHPVSTEKMVNAAKEIFELNVENYPKSAEAYFVLGTYYTFNENKELAIKNFEKSLELNPNSKKAKNSLAKLKGQ